MLGLNRQVGNLITPEIPGIISKLAGRSVAAPTCPCSAFCCLSHQRGAPRCLLGLPSKTGFCSNLLFTSHLPKVSPLPGWKGWGRESTHCISCPLKHWRSRLGKEIVNLKSQSSFSQSFFFNILPRLHIHLLSDKGKMMRFSDISVALHIWRVGKTRAIMKACWCVLIRNACRKAQAETSNLCLFLHSFFETSRKGKCREIRIKITIRCLHFREQIWAGLPRRASPVRSWFP